MVKTLDFVLIPQVREYYESFTDLLSLNIINSLSEESEVSYSHKNQDLLMELMFFQDGATHSKLSTSSFDIPSPRINNQFSKFKNKLKEVSESSPETAIIYPLVNSENSLKLTLLFLPDQEIRVYKVDSYVSQSQIEACRQTEEIPYSDCVERGTISGDDLDEVLTAFRESVEDPVRIAGGTRSLAVPTLEQTSDGVPLACRIDGLRQIFRYRCRLPLQRTLYLADLAYGLAINPIKDGLLSQEISTVVFVSEGLMLQMPMAALYDIESEQYLVEEYTLVGLPSLEGLDSNSLFEQPLSVLAFGTSSGVDNVQAPDSDQLLNLGPLPGVIEELESIRAFISNVDTFLNEAFTPNSFRNSIIQIQPSILHIATHAIFDADQDASFLVAGNGETIGVNELADFLNSVSTDRGINLDLLVLSACETARGGDRSTLGLAGILVRANIQSVLASLWLIDDTATQILMSDFYEALSTEQVNKAQALQAAQVALINNDNYQHPYFWSSFILVGDWR